MLSLSAPSVARICDRLFRTGYYAHRLLDSSRFVSKSILRDDVEYRDCGGLRGEGGGARISTVRSWTQVYVRVCVPKPL